MNNTQTSTTQGSSRLVKKENSRDQNSKQLSYIDNQTIPQLKLKNNGYLSNRTSRKDNQSTMNTNRSILKNHKKKEESLQICCQTECKVFSKFGTAHLKLKFVVLRSD